MAEEETPMEVEVEAEETEEPVEEEVRPSKRWLSAEQRSSGAEELASKLQGNAVVPRLSAEAARCPGTTDWVGAWDFHAARDAWHERLADALSHPTFLLDDRTAPRIFNLVFREACAPRKGFLECCIAFMPKR
eukprot:scaffold1944_cov241-Pinguiococcus_pyrenoidosus.AAC.19